MLPCPRRAESPIAVTSPETDRWRDDKTCSYCGSLNPEVFMRLAAAGNKIIPTDKNYKAYIEVDNALVGKRACVSSSTHPTDGYELLTEELADTVSWERTTDRERYVGRYVRFSEHPAKKTRKFYFQHFSSEQQDRFVGLLNDKKLNLAAPGYFYVLPFSVQVAATAETEA
jgi:hypothetical protein